MEIDPIVAEYDVVLARPPTAGELSLVQFPTRPEFRRGAFGSPTGASLRPRHQMLKLAYKGLQDNGGGHGQVRSLTFLYVILQHYMTEYLTNLIMN